LDKLRLRDTFYLDYPDDLAFANAYEESLLHLGKRNLTGHRKSLESGAFAAGGILSTSNDVAHFIHALFTERVVSRPMLAQMETFVGAPDEDVPEQTGYRLGIRQLVINGEVFVGHTGSISGYSGIAMHSEQKRYTIAVLSNLSIIEQTQLLAQIRTAINSE
jgi:D-alanyl-D-alanine carboxypeptidase